MNNSIKTVQAGLVSVICLGLLAACTNGTMRSRKASPEEIIEWQQKNGGGGQPAADGSTPDVDVDADADAEAKAKADAEAAAREAAAREVPTQVVGTPTELPYAPPKDHAAGTTYMEVADVAAVVSGNDALLAGEKDQTTGGLIRALSINAMGGNGQATLSIDAVVIMKSGAGEVAERHLHVANAAISTADKEVGFLPIMVSKNIYDKVGIIVGTALRVSAVCKDDCKVIQVLMLFEDSNDSTKTASALFVVQQDEQGNYGLSGLTNLSLDISSIPSFDTYVTAQAATGQPVPDEVASTTAQPVAESQTAQKPAGTTNMGLPQHKVEEIKAAAAARKAAADKKAADDAAAAAAAATVTTTTTATVKTTPTTGWGSWFSNKTVEPSVNPGTQRAIDAQTRAAAAQKAADAKKAEDDRKKAADAAQIRNWTSR